MLQTVPPYVDAQEIQSGGQTNLAEMAPSSIADSLGYALGSVRSLHGTLPFPAD